MSEEKKRVYPAAFTYKTNDEIESKILSPTLSKFVIEVYISAAEFAEIIKEKEGKSFTIEIV